MTIRRALAVHGGATAALCIAAVVFFGKDGATQVWLGFGGHLLTFVATAALACLIVLAGRNVGRNDYALASLSGLIFINAMLLTYAPLVIDAFPKAGTLNWTGKSLTLAYVIASAMLLPAQVRPAIGLLTIPPSDRWRPAGIGLAVAAALGVALAFAESGKGNMLEASIFQLTLPSLSEEILFRSLVLSLLAGIGLSSGPALPAGFGRAAIASSLMFGLVHGFLFSPAAGFVVQPVPIVATGLFGAGFAWLTIRTGSIWPAVIAHSLVNATGPLMRLIGLI
jgi:uncharacterized protein